MFSLSTAGSKGCCLAGMLRQNSIDSSGTRHRVWNLMYRVPFPWNVRIAHVHEQKPLSSDYVPSSTALLSLFLFFILTNIYLLCKIKQVTLSTCKTTFPIGLCIRGLNWGICSSVQSAAVMPCFAFDQNISGTCTHILPNVETSVMQNTCI